MRMPVYIENEQTKVEVHEDIGGMLSKAVEMSLEHEHFDTLSEVSILLTDDDGIREINKEQRNIDSPTDVLSFPLVDMLKGKTVSEEGDFDLDEELLVLGDIVISLETAKRQAVEYGHSFERELAFLTTHGVFHLLGYDHVTEEDEKEMMDKQEAVLARMGLGR